MEFHAPFPFYKTTAEYPNPNMAPDPVREQYYQNVYRALATELFATEKHVRPSQLLLEVEWGARWILWGKFEEGKESGRTWGGGPNPSVLRKKLEKGERSWGEEVMVGKESAGVEVDEPVGRLQEESAEPEGSVAMEIEDISSENENHGSNEVVADADKENQKPIKEEEPMTERGFYCLCTGIAADSLAHKQDVCTKMCVAPDHVFHYAVDCTMKCCACGSDDHTGRFCRGSCPCGGDHWQQLCQSAPSTSDGYAKPIPQAAVGALVESPTKPAIGSAQSHLAIDAPVQLDSQASDEFNRLLESSKRTQKKEILRRELGEQLAKEAGLENDSKGLLMSRAHTRAEAVLSKIPEYRKATKSERKHVRKQWLAEVCRQKHKATIQRVVASTRSAEEAKLIVPKLPVNLRVLPKVDALKGPADMGVPLDVQCATVSTRLAGQANAGELLVRRFQGNIQKENDSNASQDSQIVRAEVLQPLRSSGKLNKSTAAKNLVQTQAEGKENQVKTLELPKEHDWFGLVQIFSENRPWLLDGQSRPWSVLYFPKSGIFKVLDDTRVVLMMATCAVERIFMNAEDGKMFVLLKPWGTIVGTLLHLEFWDAGQSKAFAELLLGKHSGIIMRIESNEYMKRTFKNSREDFEKKFWSKLA